MKRIKILLLLCICLFARVTLAQLPFLPQQRNFQKKAVARDENFVLNDETNLSNNKSAEDKANDSVMSGNRNRLINDYKAQRRKVPYMDTENLARWNYKIHFVKDYTTGEFLSVYKTPRPYSIFRTHLYNYDTMNKYLYQQKDIDIFQSAIVQSTGDKTFVGVEVVSLLFGPLRFGIGGSFQSTGDTSKDQAIKTDLQKIISNRGAINLNFTLPVFYFRSKSDQFHFSVFAQTNNLINPGVYDSNGKSDFSTFYNINQSGVNIRFDLTSNDQKGGISLDFPFYYVFGMANAYNDLNIADFSLLKMHLGININAKIALNISGPLWSSSKTLQAVPFTLGLQISPSQIAKSDN